MCILLIKWVSWVSVLLPVLSHRPRLLSHCNSTVIWVSALPDGFCVFTQKTRKEWRVLMLRSEITEHPYKTLWARFRHQLKRKLVGGFVGGTNEAMHKVQTILLEEDGTHHYCILGKLDPSFLSGADQDYQTLWKLDGPRVFVCLLVCTCVCKDIDFSLPFHNMHGRFWVNVKLSYPGNLFRLN